VIRFRTDSLVSRLALLSAGAACVGIATVSLMAYWTTGAYLEDRSASVLRERKQLVERLAEEATQNEGTAEFIHKLEDFFRGHAELGFSLRKADSTVVFDSNQGAQLAGSNVQRLRFDVNMPGLSEQPLQATLLLDDAADARLLAAMKKMLLLSATASTAIIALLSGFLVWRTMRPLSRLVNEVNTVSHLTLDARLTTNGQPAELHPLIAQINALLERMQDAFLQLETFNADVAHELNTPLANLITSTEIELRNPSLSERNADYLENSLGELRRLAAIIRDMLFLARVDRGDVAERIDTLDAGRLVDDVISYHESVLQEARLSARLVGGGSIRGDSQLIKRALSNLLSNATRYATPNSVIDVEAGETSNGFRLLVCNRGEAIDTDALPKLFDRFYRADGARAQSNVNHGLGLAIVAAVAKMHAGSTLAVSESGVTKIGFYISTG
jgi:two-component system, OmpR family, heavy metal sensor histidine kinase CusS